MFRRILCLALAAVMLAAIAPAAIADGGEASPIVADECAPYAVADGEIAVAFGTNGNELLSCFADKADLSLAAANGAALSPTEAIASGATVSRGGESVVVIVPGDATGDARINARDVVAAMRAALGETERVILSAADVNADGAVNARDVIKLMRYIVGWAETLGAERSPAEADDAALTVYFASSMQRIARGDAAIHGTPDGVIRMAKNEIEDAHMILVSSQQRTGLTLDVGAIANAAGDVLDREVRYGYYYYTEMFNDLNSQDFQNTTSAWWADPYPTLDAPFDVGANENQSFIVKVKTTADTAAGWYKAPVRVLDGAGNELKKSELYVYVWDFAVDDTKLSYTMFSTGSSGLAGYFGGTADRKYYDSAVWSPLYKEYWYDYCLENKMCLEDLPYDLHDSRVDAYLDDPRVTSFVTVSGILADTWDSPDVAGIRRDYAKLSQKEEWLDKAYIYTVDEPYGAAGAEYVKKQWNGAKEVLGDTRFQTIIPFGNGWLSELGKDMLDETWDYCNAFCPLAACFTPAANHRTRRDNPELYPTWGEYMTDQQIRKYGEFAPRYEQLRERGDKMWYYICIGPYYPHANYWNSYQGAWARVVQWQQYLCHSDGFLYWSISFWNVEEHSSKMITLKRTGGGDGLLAYPGTFWSDTPDLVPSIRFEIVRDALEDYAYLRMLEDALGRDAALSYVTRLTTDVLHFTQDWRNLSSVRDELGFVLEGLVR